MESIYSKIIWDELGLKDYKIHKEPAEKTEELILNWVKNNTREKVNEVLFGLSALVSITNEGYYDGPFFGLNQREKEKRPKNEEGFYEPDVHVHLADMLPTFLHAAIKTGMSPGEFELIAKILRVYYETFPNINVCSFRDSEEGDEI